MNKTFILERHSVFLLIVCFLSSMLYVDNVFALADLADKSGITTIFCNVINQITGGIGKVISVLILISMAIGLFLGKITWGLAIAVMVGMGLLFGAKGIVDIISKGTGSENIRAETLFKSQ